MSKVSSLSGPIPDGSYLYTLNNFPFLYYGREYTNIYINYNGSITLNTSEDLFNLNIYQNHFSKKKN